MMSTNSKPRVLLIAEAANPRWVSVPLEGWSHSRAIARVTDAHVVTQIRNCDAFIEAGLIEGKDFTAIDSSKVGKPMCNLGYALSGGKGKGWTTIMAFNAISYYYFERLVWKRFAQELKAGKYDLVHRITPLSPTVPSLLAKKLAKINVPFVVGPLNGGLPWPKGFDASRRKEREWLSYVRDAYKLLPGYRSMRRNASAMIIGSRATYEQMDSRYHDRCVYIPENAIDPQRFNQCIDRPAKLPLRLAFVGRLVPYKGADMLLQAAAPLIRQGKVIVDLIGDGPMKQELIDLAKDLKISDGVIIDGWVEHTQLQDRLLLSDVFAFPSIREFGGAVVLEAMALGLVPVVLDYGGPGELVSPETGYAIPMGNRQEIISRFSKAFEELTADPANLRKMGSKARQRVLNSFTWDAKAAMVLQVYQWVMGQRQDKPTLGMPLPDGCESTVMPLVSESITTTAIPVA
jgi:glycosyltransferase involved in cell wall biosynthesis